MPENCGMAFVVIQHLDPKYRGIMPELLQRATSMQVFQATDQLKIKENCVYVIPPNKSMSMLNGALYLFPLKETQGLRLPIDVFFKSLALDKQEKSIGIILSGMGSDGSLGVKAIKEKYGVVLVQDPLEAKFEGMPQSAIEAVTADSIASATELPFKLINILKFSDIKRSNLLLDTKHQSYLNKIVIILREQTGHDFSQYKKNTLMRRIERRKGIHHINKIDSYERFLQDNPQEIEILFKELLIGVTAFFRDDKLWDALRNKVIPQLIKNLPDKYVLRAWIPACSTGEEAYSLAIVFKEVLEEFGKNRNLSLQIFATDLDVNAIEKARKGYFQKNIEEEVSKARLNQFFKVQHDGYVINNTIREMIVFAPQNVIKDPPFTKLDILSCRNMLIYMETGLQQKLMALFNYSLNLGGILILGSSETLGSKALGFSDVDAKIKIFKRTNLNTVPELIDFPSSFHKGKVINTIKEVAKMEENIQTLADKLLLEHFVPPSTLVNEKGDILYISGRTGKYLEPVAGKANWNVYAMARKGLAEVLPSAFRQAKKSYDPIIIRDIKVGTNGGSQFIDLTVQRLTSPEALKNMFMIVFTDTVQHQIMENSTNLKTTKNNANQEGKLELELQRSHEELQLTREEMQTSQEELRSTNEELQSTNEELQSTNEELTTSKEEMQSLNEELQTVNVELQSKINDFEKANSDMKNLLNSIEIATLFLDKDLNIRRFTDQTLQIFKIRTSDVGRPFTDIVMHLDYPEMDEHARQVLKNLVPIERSILSNTSKWYKVRIMPYRTADDRIDGLVITFSDITEAKVLELELKKANEALKN